MTAVRPDEVAYKLGCSIRHVHNLIARGLLTNAGSPRRVLINLDEVHNQLKAGAIHPRPRATRTARDWTT